MLCWGLKERSDFEIICNYEEKKNGVIEYRFAIFAVVPKEMLRSNFVGQIYPRFGTVCKLWPR